MFPLHFQHCVGDVAGPRSQTMRGTVSYVQNCSCDPMIVWATPWNTIAHVVSVKFSPPIARRVSWKRLLLRERYSRSGLEDACGQNQWSTAAWGILHFFHVFVKSRPLSLLYYFPVTHARIAIWFFFCAEFSRVFPAAIFFFFCVLRCRLEL